MCPRTSDQEISLAGEIIHEVVTSTFIGMQSKCYRNRSFDMTKYKLLNSFVFHIEQLYIPSIHICMLGIHTRELAYVNVITWHNLHNLHYETECSYFTPRNNFVLNLTK